jgi:hypothetical protein
MKYLIEQSVLERAAHHQSIEALWETKWRKRVSNPQIISRWPRTILTVPTRQVVPQIYPFWEGKIEDFEGIFRQLVEVRTQWVVFLR